MAAAASISVSGTVTGLPTGSKVVGPMTITSATAIGAVTDVVLAAGDNTITVPSGASAAIIQFGAGSTSVKKLKGAGADTGITVTKIGTCVLHFDAAGAPANFIINSSALDTGITTEITFV